MLIKVERTDLLQSRALPFDLFSVDQVLLLAQGTELSTQTLKSLRGEALYRLAPNDPIDHEGVLLTLPDRPLTPLEKRQQILENSQSSLYGDPLEKSFLRSIHLFWNGLAQGESPDIALCELIRDKMVSELTSKVDQVYYLSQLRVRDEYTYSHTLNVAALSIALAIKAGFTRREVRDIGLASILHDLGKLMIPKAIMFKASRLTEKEFEVMKRHPMIGYRMIVDEMRLPEAIGLPALEHQEMFGGGGYPQNLQKNEIHPMSQIVKVADVYDALTSKRPYKDSIPSAKAVSIMASEGAKSFNPELLQHFIELSNYQPEVVQARAS